MLSPRLFIIALFPIYFFTGCQAPSQEVLPPNIVLFFVDDLGWQDTSEPFWIEKTPFNERYTTPNMELLARQGMKFTQAYATPVCSPTRISLMSGMNAARHRVTNWTLYKDAIQPMEKNHPGLSFPLWNVNGMSMDTATDKAVHVTPLPYLLQQAGYRTIHVGKAHFGAIGTPGEDPVNLGFDVNIAGHAAGGPKSYLGKDNFGNIEKFKGQPWPVPGLEKYHGQDINLTEALTQEALSALEAPVREGQPFFLYLSHYTVHTPIMADDRFFQRYLEAGLDTVEARYASMVEGMDKSLGDVMSFLEEKKINEHTVILFMSDNGGLSAVARGGEKHTHNKPLSSGKGAIHEGGIREPMIVKWPGMVQANSLDENYLIIEDFFPTILEIAGVKQYETRQAVDGISFVDRLKGEKEYDEKRPLFWHYPNEWGPSGPGIGAFSAIRQGDWKLIYYHLDQRFELFNIKEDIGETVNRTEAEPEITSALAKWLSNYLREVNAQMPRKKSTGELVPLPDKWLLSDN